MHIAGLALKRRTFLTLGAILGLVALVVAQVAAFTPALPTSAANAPAPLAHGLGAPAVSTGVVLSQVYGGGGNGGATYTNDFIELFNRGTTTVSVTGWSVQYAGATGSTWQVTNLSGSLAPGQYYLVQEAQGTGGTTPLPTPDAIGTIAMSGTAGKVALVNNTTALTGTCPTGASIIDFAGFGTTANCFEGTGPTPAPSNTTAVLRAGAGCTDTDNNSTDFSAGAPTPRNTSTAFNPCGAGTATPTVTPGGPTATATATPSNTPTATATATVGPPSARIHDIQGAAHRSPLNGTTVSNVPGIVTAKQSNGFYLQDPSPDANDATSEAIFVFGSAAAGTVNVGDSVAVSGTVSEFRPGGAASTNLTTTEIGSPTVSVLSSGNPLPTPVVIGTGGRVPPDTVIEDDATGDVETSGVFDPANDGIDFYESLESMRVQVNNAVASGPTHVFGTTTQNREIPVLADNGANATVRTTRGGIVIRATDFNPERIILNDVISGGPNLPTANVGDTFPGAITGIMDYTFGNFKLQVQTLPALVSGGLAREVAALVTDPNQISFGAFNVENLDPTDPQSKFDTLAGLIVNNLRSPDILSIEEIQDNTGPTDNGVVDASQTWGQLINAIATAGGPTYQYRQIDPVNDQDGGEPGGNIRVGFLFRTDRGVSFVDRAGGTSTAAVSVVNGANGPELSFSPGRIDPTNAAFNSSRKPLAGEFLFNGHHLFVIANHFNSKGGDDPLFGHPQPPVRSSETQRHQQAQIVHDFVASILALDPAANIVVDGDLNDFEFSDTLNILKSGPVLYDLIETLAVPERYTYVFEGNSQAIDHILVSPQIFTNVPFTEDVVHVNSEFADQASDHEPQVARFTLPPAGAVTATATATATDTAVPPTVTTTAVPPTATDTAVPSTVTATAVAPTSTTTAVAGTATTTATAVAETSTATAVASTATTTAVAATATATAVAATATATATPVNCPLPFTDVDQFNPFYQYIQCLYCRGIISGYSDNTFRWSADVTRGQVSKIVANAAGLNDAVSGQTFTDVPAANPFYVYIERLSAHGYISGYDTAANCPTGTPCFRWELPVTRGQLAKIDANAAGYAETPPTGTQSFVDVPPSQPFYVFIERLSLHGVINGYTCGGPGEPCPGFYYRPNANITRGQTSKVVSQSFFPNACAPAQPAAAITR